MKEFNLELAKAGHPVCTRDGKPVRIVCFDAKGNYPILALALEDNNDEELPLNYTNEGFYYDTETSSNDLMMVSEAEENDIKEAIKYAIAASTHEDGILLNGVTESEAIAWLEKKCEQNPADKVEPKFHVGDWIVKNDGKDCFSDGSYVLQITGIDCNKYNLSNGCCLVEPFVDEYRLWTIQDAKDGDVLAYPDGSITLFKYMAENIYMAHVLWVDGHIELNNSCAIFNVHPATKEQRDLLFRKMHEAGYEWDDDKKELKKIEQKSAWSEEDENAIKVLMNIIKKSEIIDNLIYTGLLKEKLYDWLKSLKDRFQQQNK